MTFSLEKGSVAPDLLMTRRMELSAVLNRLPQLVHSRLLRIWFPSSVGRESITLESSNRQNGQITSGLLLLLLAKRGKSTLAENHYLWKPQA